MVQLLAPSHLPMGLEREQEKAKARKLACQDKDISLSGGKTEQTKPTSDAAAAAAPHHLSQAD